MTFLIQPILMFIASYVGYRAGLTQGYRRGVNDLRDNICSWFADDPKNSLEVRIRAIQVRGNRLGIKGERVL